VVGIIAPWKLPLFWFTVNWRISPYALVYDDGGIHHAQKRKNYTGQKKIVILKRHLVNQVQTSDLYDDDNPQPIIFCRWQKALSLPQFV